MAKQQPTSTNKKADMIYCERCGEDYSATYRRCPFCDERPGRRIDDHGTRSPLQLAVLIVTLVIILAAAFIVFSKVAPLLTNQDPVVENPGVEQPDEPVADPGTQTPEVVLPEVPDKTDPNAVPAHAIVLSRTDITLVHGETYSLAATVAPSDTTDTVVWSSDRPDVLDVSPEGALTNKNTTGEKVVVNVTATAGGVSATCVVRCNSGAVSLLPPTTGEPVSGNTPAKVTNAGNGLNVRSGPGSNYNKVASIANGTSVTILEDAGNGWYKIDYGNGKTGYASASYIVPTGESGSGSTSGGSTSSSGAAISGKTPARVVGAGNGLNVRSGPGSNYEKIASIANGNSVTILENAGNGFYKIDYGNGKIGYASVNYIQPK